MAGTCLIRCVLIQVLLITVYGKSTDITLNCSNQTGTVGEPLHLTCSVTCEECQLTKIFIKSNIKNPDSNCIDEQREVTSDKIHTFYCTIPRASEKHNKTFKFWVQLKTGIEETTFNVIIVPRVPTTTAAVFTAGLPAAQEQKTGNGRSPTVVVAVMVMFCLAICAMATLLFRGTNCNMSISGPCLNNMTDTDPV